MTRLKVSRHFDSGVGVLGAVVALCALTLQVAHASTFESSYLLAVPLIMVMGWFPMLVGRQGGGIEIGLDTCILIFLGTIAQPETALVVWSLGVTLGQVLSEKKRSTQIFNSALGVTAGGLAILVLELTRSGAPTSPRELLAAGLAGVVYFVVDFVVSAISLVIDDESKFREAFSPTEIPGPLIAFLGIAALGYLGRWSCDTCLFGPQGCSSYPSPPSSSRPGRSRAEPTKHVGSRSCSTPPSWSRRRATERSCWNYCGPGRATCCAIRGWRSGQRRHKNRR